MFKVNQLQNLFLQGNINKNALPNVQSSSLPPPTGVKYALDCVTCWLISISEFRVTIVFYEATFKFSEENLVYLSSRCAVWNLNNGRTQNTICALRIHELSSIWRYLLFQACVRLLGQANNILEMSFKHSRDFITFSYICPFNSRLHEVHFNIMSATNQFLKKYISGTGTGEMPLVVYLIRELCFTSE